MIRLLIISLFSILIVGCQHQPQRNKVDSEADSGLNQWVENQLVPYVTTQLSQHSRFKGESVILVKFRGQDLQPEIDQLTSGIRRQLRDAMLAAPGINIPWRPNSREPQHHTRLSSAACSDQRKAAYYLALEITPQPNGEYALSIRALDIAAREWVSGFGISWRGQLTSMEQQALVQGESDESLRGLRALPFGQSQSDLAANYLANNLSCLLQQQDQQQLTIKIEPADGDKGDLKTLLALIGNNLSRYREVRISDKTEEANYLLRGELHSLEPNLNQIWVVLTPKGSGVHLSGVDTATYQHAGEMIEHSVAEQRMEPVYSQLEMQLHAGSPSYNNYCVEGAPELCRSLSVDAANARSLFVVALNERGVLSRIYPASCGSSPSSLPLPMTRLETTYYALATSNHLLSQKLRRKMHQLPDGCDDTGAAPMSPADLDRWIDHLDELAVSYGDQLSWVAERNY
ncbi:MAG: hypothetical protein GY934_22360 [Gammaproteobacteria bacterium]|nr:hypothetical protein [Gammaproteobacteria bacterium]